MQLAVEPSRVEAVLAEIAAYLEGRATLTGLDLYYRLEQTTPLREFHTVLRSGPQNRTRSGLQQSYGDHNRLLLLGLDKLLEGDLSWYRERLAQPGAVDDARLQACFEEVRRLGLTRRACIALWLGAALHDCGMLGGSDGNVDVEDGVVLADDVLDTLCPDDVRMLASFAIRELCVSIARWFSEDGPLTAEQVARYRVEPYVVAADVYGRPPHVGRGGWT